MAVSVSRAGCALAALAALAVFSSVRMRLAMGCSDALQTDALPAYGSGTGINRHKCEIVHRRPELAVLTFGHSLIHTCNRPAKSRALHFNPGCRLSGRSLTGVHSGNEGGCSLISSSECTKPQSLRRQDAFIATLEMGNRDFNSIVLRHLHLDAPNKVSEAIRRPSHRSCAISCLIAGCG